MAVNTEHPQYVKNAPLWKRIRDAVDGEAVKAGKVAYLPKPEGRSDSDYSAYHQRAAYYNFCQPTLSGLTGAAFRKGAVVELPAVIESMGENIDGQGLTLEEQAKGVVADVASVGRDGLFLNYPALPEGTTKPTRQQVADMALQWTVSVYDAECIINWKTYAVGSQRRYSMVVLREDYMPETADKFETQSKGYQYRVLWINPDDSLFWIELHKPIDGESRDASKPNATSPGFTVELFEPRDSAGNRLTFIPFEFVGIEENTPEVDLPPFLPLADINLSHYISSAELEDAAHMVGQPTPIVKMGEEHWRAMAELNGGKLPELKIGSNTAWPLPEAGDAYLMESRSDKTIIERTMDRKQSQAQALGAKLIEGEKAGVEGVETHVIRQNNQTAVLSSSVSNVDKAYNRVLKWAAELAGGNPEDVTITLNTDFFNVDMDGKTALDYMGLYHGRVIARDDLHKKLQQGEIIDQGRSVEDIDEDNESDQTLATASIPMSSDDASDDE